MSEEPGAPRNPWDADHELSVADVEAVIAQALPELAGATVRVLGEGWDYRAFDAGSEVLRFPKRADVAEEMEREAAVLRALAPRLPLAVPRLIPCAPVAHAPHGFTRHAKIPGVPLLGIDLPRSQARWIATLLGGFFSALHGTPASVVAGLGLPDAGWRDPSGDKRRSLARLRGVASRMPRDVVQRAERAIDAAPSAGAGARTVTHSDPWPEHVLVDEVSLEPTGVIDWADAELGDPAYDLAGLWYLGGDEGLEAGLRRYEHPWDQALVARARFFAVHHAVGDAWYAQERGLPDYLRQAIAALSRLP